MPQTRSLQHPPLCVSGVQGVGRPVSRWRRRHPL